MISQSVKMELDNSKSPAQRPLRKRHWRFALLTVFRLRRTHGLVDDENLAALKITLHPPSFSTTLSSELTSQLDSYISSEDFVEIWKCKIDSTAESKQCPLTTGEMYCSQMSFHYLNISQRKFQLNGYWCWHSG